jgi:hypothetical protein
LQIVVTTVFAVVVLVDDSTGALLPPPQPANSNAAIDTAMIPAKFRFISGILKKI